MNRRKGFTRALALVALATGLAVIVVAWNARRVKAIQDPDFFISDFGFVDVGPGQTARLSVVSVRHSLPPDSETPPPDPDIPGSPNHARRLRLSFDIYIQPPPEPDEPSCIRRYRFLRRDFCDLVLRRGEVVSYDYTAAEGTKVAASIHSLGGPDTREGEARVTPEPHLTPMLQVLEGARTVFVVPATIRGFNPQPETPATR